jgi:hypothetical protein
MSAGIARQNSLTTAQQRAQLMSMARPGGWAVAASRFCTRRSELSESFETSHRLVLAGRAVAAPR